MTPRAWKNAAAFGFLAWCVAIPLVWLLALIAADYLDGLMMVWGMG